MLWLWAWLGRMVYFTAGIVFMPIFINGSRRVRIAIIDPDTNEILLGKSWIGAQRWDLIGGGIMKNEDKFVAAIREVKEETGLDISTDQLEYIGQITESEYLSTFSSHIFKVHVKKQPTSRPKIEMVALDWHPLKKLPQPININNIKAIDHKSS